MSRLVPHPVLTALLLLTWLVLTRFSLGQVVLGTLVALLAGWAMGRLRAERPSLRRPAAVLPLLGIVLWDVLRSNWAVASLILTGGRRGERRSGFVEVPLRLRDPSALAALAVIVTATPGTAWLEHDEASGVLLLHVFDLKDEAEWRELIQARYERRLMEIFE